MVRNGSDFFLPNDFATGKPQHTMVAVYTEMFLQVCAEYQSLPDPRTLSLSEIRFFYDGIRGSLRKYTAPGK